MSMSCLTPVPSNVIDLCSNDDDVASDQEIILISPKEIGKQHRKRPFVAIGEHISSKRPKQNKDAVATQEIARSEVEVVKQRRVPSQLEEVLAVFPDVKEKHAKDLLTKLNYDAAKVVQLLAENSYPKEDNSKKKLSQENVADRRPTSKTAIIQHRNEHSKRTYKYDFMSESSFKPCQSYKMEAKQLLMQDFLFLTNSFLQKVLIKFKWKYAICHDRLCQALKLLKESDPSTKHSSPEAIEQSQFSQLQATITISTPDKIRRHQVKNLIAIVSNGGTSENRSSILVKKIRKSCKLQLKNEILREEHSFVQNKQHTYRRRMKEYEKRIESRREAEQTQSTIECNCCFVDVAIDEMVQCREAHLFCFDCVRKFAETQIFGMNNFGINPKTKQEASELLCLSGCGAGLEGLEKSLPENVWARYNEMQFQAAVSQAKMDDICHCPKCGYQAAVPKTEMIFRCPVGECGHESCRKCGEEPHIPLKCSEVEKKNETKGRVRVEEAITEAKIRKCPNCRKKIVKDSGCNKMTCACGTNFCYICRAKIDKKVGYNHFCQRPHCSHKSCGRCLLYTNAEQDDEQCMREAGLRAAEEVRGDSLLGDNADDSKEVNVNVDKILGKTLTPKVNKKKSRRIR